MFHFWFNTFFVAVDHEEQTVTLKSSSDGRDRTPRSTTSTSSTAKQHSTVKPVQTTASSSRLQLGASSSEQTQSRCIDKVAKSAVARTSSGNSSASSSTRGSASVRRPGQQRDTASVRPRSVHLSGTLPVSDTASDHQGSASSSKVGQTGKTTRDKLQTTYTQQPRPLHSQEPKRSAAAQTNGRSKTVSQEGRKTPAGESSVVSARGIPGSSKGVGQRQFVSRSDSMKLSRPKGETASTASDHNGTFCRKENAVNEETVDQRVERSAATGNLKTTLSTPDLRKTGVKDSATSRSIQQPNSATKAPSGVPRYIQRDVANRNVLTTNKTAASQRVAGSRQSSANAVIKGSSLVSPSVQTRSERVPSDTVSLTRYAQRNTQQQTSAKPVPGRQSSAPAELQSKSSPVFEVSGSSSSPTTFCTLTLAKSEIDKANKDVQHKVYSSDFKVSAPGG